MKYLKLFEDFETNDNQFLSPGIGDDMISNEIDMDTDMGDENTMDNKDCNCQCDSCVCTSDGCKCTNCECTNCVDDLENDEFSEDEMITDDTIGEEEEVEQDGTHLSKFGEFNEKKMNAGFKAYLDKKKAKSDKKDDNKDKKADKTEKADKKDDKKKGLTAGQKKLPEAMQKAILKKQK